MTFDQLGLHKQLFNGVSELGFEKLTPIQEEAFPIVKSGTDVVGISQTGTGKTFAYLLPILNELKYSNQVTPRALIVVPTRELVEQVVQSIKELTTYVTIRTLGLYGEANMNTQAQELAQGKDIIVATPGRLYDLLASRAMRPKAITKLVIDEVDVMLDLGFKPQLGKIVDLLPAKRQNIMFSATMTDEVEELIDDIFVYPKKISIAPSGTPLANIEQSAYHVVNFYTKANLVRDLLLDKSEFEKVLVFVSSKKNADILFELLEDYYAPELGIIHSNKTQNFRLRAIEEFDAGRNRILIATDVIARGVDMHKVSHVINIDTPQYPENYMHRIGRTGRADEKGKSILMYTEKEIPRKKLIEDLMGQEIPDLPLPVSLEITEQKLPEERERPRVKKNRKTEIKERGEAFHEKSAKNSKVNMGSSYKRKVERERKKPIRRGDKIQNEASKRNKKRR